MCYTADLGNGTYRNPIFNGDYPDPAVLRDGDTFYLTASTGRHYPGLTIYRSRDLVNWEPACHPLREFDGEVWAPDLVRCRDRYYLYFCAGGTNWVLWSDNILKGWSKAIDLKVGHIDPGHCEDEKGNRYLFLSGGYVAPLTTDGLALAGDPVKVMEIAPLPAGWDIEGDFPESPKITCRNGYFYLTYANGGTAGPATAHGVFSMRARHPMGPWEPSPCYPVLRTESRDERWHCKGHGHLVDDLAGNWWIVYHAYEKDYYNQGRKLLLEPVEWTEDGWLRTKEGVDAAGPIAKPVASASCGTGGIQLSDDFTGGKIKTWRAWGDSACTRYCPGEGRLRLPGLGRHIGDSQPLTISAGDHSWAVTTEVAVGGGCEAGLTLFYNSHFYNGVGLREGALTVYRLGHALAGVPVKSSRLYLKMESREGYCTFYYSYDNRVWTKLNYVLDTVPQNNNAYGGFLALRPGIFACGGGVGEFSFFQYDPDCGAGSRLPENNA